MNLGKFFAWLKLENPVTPWSSPKRYPSTIAVISVDTNRITDTDRMTAEHAPAQDVPGSRNIFKLTSRIRRLQGGTIVRGSAPAGVFR